ncbi:MAG TPA: zinc-binding alcohol dehydrogenase family protein [Anaerolineae bacterium]|nr:zinc-binding alcohol dehydrogenase family protein [Anaerolineae bacterium]HIQ05663.1 zinc-binding alcohol dehydrogenase family protein [Anaerolineae bacterium]
MKAMVLKATRPIEQNPLEFIDVPTPTPGPDEIRIEIRVCGVCHTDLHEIEGDLEMPKLPVIPGHQIVGMVDQIGENVTRFRLGDRVGIPWLYSTCGECDYCRRGLENLCEHARFTGYHVDGGYAQYIVVPEQFAYPIPEGYSDTQAAPLLCAGVIGYRALRLSEVQPGQRLGLYGFGASAHVIIQVAIYQGCEVYVFTRSPEHQKLAAELGAVWVGQAQDTPPELLDSAIIFAPAGWIVPESLRVLRRGGTVAMAGIHMTPIPEMPYSLIYGERTLRSVANSTRQDVRELLEIAPKVPIRTEVELFPLEEANQVLQRLKRSEIRGAAVLEIPPR